MEQAAIFILRSASGWRVAVGDQRLGTYETAQDASWAAMSLAVHIRGERIQVEIRLHDESGIRKIWPPVLPEDLPVEEKRPDRTSSADFRAKRF